MKTTKIIQGISRKKGLFIVIEGIDGSGKGTQSKLLYNWLGKKGYDAQLTQEPTEGKIGMIIRGGLKGGGFDPTTEALLFAADRRQHTTLIQTELKKGKVVVCDRYVQSSLAYQGAHGLDSGWLESINNFALKPDVVILLDLSPELALERVNSRGKKTDYFEKMEFLKRVREIYLNQPEVLVVDASRSIDEVHETIKGVVLRFL
jgi:dTMP kinase